MRDNRIASFVRKQASGRRYLLAAIAVAGIAMAVSGCRQPPWEIRCYHPGAASMYTDSGGTGTWQYGKSTVEGRWVCPYCGYSTPVVANPGGINYCPNPWMVPGHPANVQLQFQPLDRCFLSTTGTPVTHPDGSTLPAVVGLPFHPKTGDDVEGSVVRLAASGIENNPDVVANDTSGDHYRFLVLEPGARYPAAQIAPGPDGTPAMGYGTVDDGIGLTPARVHINPFRVTDGEVFHVQRYSNANYNNNGQHNGNNEAIRIYSSLDGLVFYWYGHQAGTGNSGFSAVSVVASDGSVRIDMPGAPGSNPNGPPNGNGSENTEVSAFQIASNAHIIPGVGEDNSAADADPTDWTQPAPAWPWNGQGTPPDQDWPVKQNYFRIPSNGLIADWITPVVGSGAPVVNPYVIPEGAVGKGWVIAEWQSAQAAATIATTPNTKASIANTATGNTWVYDDPYPQFGAEWNYDWLVETHGGGGNPYGDPADARHLWANAWACATDTILTGFHEESTAADHYQAGNPVPFFVTSFISSRLQIPPTGQAWDKTGTGTPAPVPLESDTDPGRGIATLLVGQGNPAGGTVTGSYEPGTTTPTRQAIVYNRMTPVLRCPRCGSVDTDLNAQLCPYCGAPLTQHGNMLPGDAVTALSMQDPPSLLTASGRRPPAYAASRPAITESALSSDAGQGLYAPWQTPPPPVPSPDMPQPYLFALGLNLPSFLPPSAPMVGTNPATSDLANDPGYFGRLVMVSRPQYYNGQTTLSTEASADTSGRGYAVQPDPTNEPNDWKYNHRWDVGYRSPSSGAWEPDLTPAAASTAAAYSEASAGTDQGYQICPIGGIPVPIGGGSICPYCGSTTLTTWSGTSTFCGLSRVTAYDVDSEEFAPFNLVVSVLRKLDLVNATDAIDLGRVAPGVPVTAPDTTVGGITIPPSPFPAPSNVSMPDPTAPNNIKGRAFSVLNNGNVYAPLSASSVQDTDLTRAGTDTGYGAISYPEKVSDVPLPWNLLIPTVPLTGLAGGTIGGAAGGDSTAYLQAGNAAMPIPLGQPAGVHTGRVIVYTDLNGNGALDFYHPGVGVTTTATTTFDPSIDLPLEPVADVNVRLRVGEGRIPQDGYFSADVAPALAFDPGMTGAPGTLHIVWMGNRAPASAVGSTAPAGTSTAAVPTPSSPFNLLYANANALLVPDVLGNDTYRGFDWAGSGGVPTDAKALTTDAAPGTINESPFVLPTTGVGGVANNLALWHQLLPNANGWQSTLHYNQSTAPDYSGSGGFVFSSSRHMQGLKAIYYNGMPWLFWNAGAEGQQRIYSLPNFNPATPTAGTEVPISLAYGSTPHHERAQVWNSGAAGDYIMAQKFSASPFSYERDPMAWITQEYNSSGGTDNVLNLVFTGYVRGDGNTDICWAKFIANPALSQKEHFPRLSNRVNLPGTGTPALAFGEELKPDMRRQYFSSQHLEWVCHDNSDTDNFAVSPNPALQDPQIFVAIASSGAVPTYVYSITWQNGTWSRARNAYYVQPRFTMIYPTSGADPLNAARALPGQPAAGYLVADPSTTAQATPQPLTMEINPAAGTVRFSAPLFDTETPVDSMAVLNGGNMVTATDVQVYANYTPMIWRITRDPAADDCPWAFWSPGDTGSLCFFWRRSYSPADTPFEGRSVFMYKQWAPSVQVLHPAITGTPTVEASYDNGATWNTIAGTDYDLYASNGFIVFHNVGVNDQMGPEQVPFLVRVSYTGAGGATYSDEQHLVLSWTQERRVPIDAEVAAGPMSVAHESYAAALAGGGTVTVGRFWIAWSSPRSLLDLRPVASGGGVLRQSSDIYLASVVPSLSDAVAEAHPSSLPAGP